jgi:hypothetical protein
MSARGLTSDERRELVDLRQQNRVQAMVVCSVAYGLRWLRRRHRLHELGGWEASTGLDSKVMQQTSELPCTLAGILVPVQLVFILPAVGLIVLAVGLGRAGVLPYWLALVDANRHGGHRRHSAVSRRPGPLRPRPGHQLRVCRPQAAKDAPVRRYRWWAQCEGIRMGSATTGEP